MMPPDDNDSERLERSLIDVAVESWRLARLLTRIATKLDVGEANRCANQIRYAQKRIDDSLEAHGILLVSVEGQPFDPGVAASALNVGDFDAEDPLLIDQMIEPIVMGRDGLKRQGTVMLRKAHS